MCHLSRRPPYTAPMRTLQHTEPSSNYQRSQAIVMARLPADWSAFFASGLKASAGFMADVEHLRIQERVVNGTPRQKVERV